MLIVTSTIAQGIKSCLVCQILHNKPCQNLLLSLSISGLFLEKGFGLKATVCDYRAHTELVGIINISFN